MLFATVFNKKLLAIVPILLVIVVSTYSLLATSLSSSGFSHVNDVLGTILLFSTVNSSLELSLRLILLMELSIIDCVKPIVEGVQNSFLPIYSRLLDCIIF